MPVGAAPLSDAADDAISGSRGNGGLLAQLAAWDWDQLRDAVSVKDIG
jgi:hypothetical protein